MEDRHHIFLTGRLARPRLEKILSGLADPGFTFEVRDIGVKVAALMTEPIIKRRLEAPVKASAVYVPGRTRMDLTSLSHHFGVPFLRGPDEINDLPPFFGKAGINLDLSKHDIRIFAEIVDAPALSIEQLLARARAMAAASADVIDLGCQPGVPFPHLEDAINALKQEGFKVSVDSGDFGELERGAHAGADALLSLTRETLALARDTGIEAVLVPSRHGDLDSLIEAIDQAAQWGLRIMADPVLDPIHFGFTDSLRRYARVRRARPDTPMLMGTGNLTELTEADTSGITALLLGICSELEIGNVLVVQVSPHTRRTLQEHDAARRLMYAARRDQSLPKGYGGQLLQVHELSPFAVSPDEIAEIAGEVRDRNYRIEVAEDGIHIYNATSHHVSTDALSLYPKLGVENDAAHAFYLAQELMKAEIAFLLGKRYAQDEPLRWGVGADRKPEDLTRLAERGHTLRPNKDQS
jgi:dihydropteroate synthase-like protein